MRGTLRCDFSSRRLQRAMMVVNDLKFQTILGQFRTPQFADRQRLDLVHMFAPFTFLTCKQAGAILRTFGVGSDTVLAATTLFSRVADAETALHQLVAGLNERDRGGFTAQLGCYESLRFSNPTGAPPAAARAPLSRRCNQATLHLGTRKGGAPPQVLNSPTPHPPHPTHPLTITPPPPRRPALSPAQATTSCSCRRRCTSSSRCG